jgi:hypothetical protein
MKRRKKTDQATEYDLFYPDSGETEEEIDAAIRAYRDRYYFQTRVQQFQCKHPKWIKDDSNARPYCRECLVGMFDYVTHAEIDCPECGAKVSDFQSKDNACFMDTIPFWEVNNFYTMCRNCKTWIEFDLVPREPRPPRPLTDYTMRWRRFSADGADGEWRTKKDEG